MDRGKEILYIILGRRRTGKRMPVGWVKLHSSAQIEVVEYRYDGIGRRVEKIVNGTVTEYIYDRENVILEYNSSNELQRANIYTLNVDEILQTTVGANNYYYNSDHLGSITEITDTNGQLIEKYDYDPFGNPQIIDPATGSLRKESVIGNRYLFTAREWDSDTSLYYYRARYYNSSTGRFLSTDPALKLNVNKPYLLYSFLNKPPELHAYLYVGENPINRTDSSGMSYFCDVICTAIPIPWYLAPICDLVCTTQLDDPELCHFSYASREGAKDCYIKCHYTCPSGQTPSIEVRYCHGKSHSCPQSMWFNPDGTPF